MTFTKNALENLYVELMTPNNSIDMEFDDDNRTINVLIGGLESWVCRFFDIDLDEEYPDGWINSYAVIDPARSIVTKLFFSVVLNTKAEKFDGQSELELQIELTNRVEGRAVFDALVDSDSDLLDLVQQANDFYYSDVTLEANAKLSIPVFDNEDTKEARERLEVMLIDAGINGSLEDWKLVA